MSVKHYAPLGFSMVDTGIYRSAYPTERTFSFITLLNLKSMVFLNSADSKIKSQLENFAQVNSIQLKEFDIKCNIEPFMSMSEESIDSVLEFVQGLDLCEIF